MFFSFIIIFSLGLLFSGPGFFLLIFTLKENYDTSSATGRLGFQMMGAIAEFERSITRERQLEGIARAKKEGKYKGRTKIPVPADFEELYERYQTANRINPFSLSEFAKKLGFSTTTLARMIKKYRLSNNLQEQKQFVRN